MYAVEGAVHFYVLENSPKKARARIGQKSCLYNSMETDLALAVDVVMARAKIIYIFIIKVNKLFSFFSCTPCFYRVIETRVEVWENEKLCEHEPQASVSTAFSSSPKLSRVFL